MTEIVIQMRGSSSAEVDSSVRDVQRDLANLNIRLEPLYAGASDQQLRGWFQVAIPAGHRTEDVIMRLREHPDVEAAYEKPSGSPP